VPRETSPYIVGEYWLDKRRDGASPDIWQATTYKPGSRQVVYRSTKCRRLEDAQGWLHSYVDDQRAKKPQQVEDAKVVPALFVYWREHGKKAERPDSIAGSIRHFLGFLLQDDATVTVTFAEADRAMFARFIAWRMGPHSYELEWEGKTYSYSGQGVKGETVHSDLARVSAALNHQVEFGRVPMAPRVAKVDKRERSTPRTFRFTVKQMGAIIAVAAMGSVRDNGQVDEDGLGLFRHLLLQLGTLVRPTAAHAFDPRAQFDRDSMLIDLHPPGKARTRKRNPIIPALPEMVPFLTAWAEQNPPRVRSRKTAWRTLKALLELPEQAEPKTFRRTVASILRNRFKRTVPKDDIQVWLGHKLFEEGATEAYAIYDPDYMGEIRDALSTIFREVMAEAYAFAAVQLLSKTGNDATVLLDRSAVEAENLQGSKNGAAYRTRTCDPRITNARKRRRTAEPREVRPERSDDA
jgi:hypothetical protein